VECFICIHGHYYQPPRENPWLEEIETQDSAYPYHNWNERITAECYEPNAAARILDGEGRIVKIVNNYAHTSFNVGPTLLAWMEDHASTTYQLILAADRESQQLFSGHGTAIAQVYNHMIMPLANRQDKITQVCWGLRDFEHRFGRPPEGLWLGETAVDLETLEILADHGLRYTILAPSQASQVRRFRGRNWHDVTGGRIDPTMAYEIRLPSKRRFALFFYDGPISQAVAFEGLLNRGDFLADRLIGAASDQRDWPQLIHIATDGETYGHHHSQGDMALAYALHHINKTESAKITNYGEFLEQHPPTHEVRIFENSSWSCVHGVERWRSDCGCNTGGQDGWNQSWRGPLRDALDWLRDSLRDPFEKMGSQMFTEPWAARNGYIDVVLDRSEESVKRFLEKHTDHRLGDAVSSNAMQLLEIQRQCMLMYTSCGWFFNDLSGIETVQVLHYAGRAIQLAEQLLDIDLETGFCDRLALATSNLPEHQDGRHLYEKHVRSARIDLAAVGAHFAVSSLFEDYQQENTLACYTANLQDFQVHKTGRAKLAVGQATIRSSITLEKARLCFGVIHWGDHNLHGGVHPYEDDDAYQSFVRQVTEAFQHAEFPVVAGLLDQHFHASTYSIRSLFRDKQRKILNLILDSGPAERAYRQLFEQNAPAMSFLAGLGAPNPKAFQMAADYVLNLDLRKALEQEVDSEHIQELFDKARLWRVHMDTAGLSYLLEQRLREKADALRARPQDTGLLEQSQLLVSIAEAMDTQVNVRPLQNIIYQLSTSVYPEVQKCSQQNTADQDWCIRFRDLYKQLSVYID